MDPLWRHKFNRKALCHCVNTHGVLTVTCTWGQRDPANRAGADLMLCIGVYLDPTPSLGSAENTAEIVQLFQALIPNGDLACF